jgi:hypothetical protein
VSRESRCRLRLVDRPTRSSIQPYTPAAMQNYSARIRSLQADSLAASAITSKPATYHFSADYRWPLAAFERFPRLEVHDYWARNRMSKARDNAIRDQHELGAVTQAIERKHGLDEICAGNLRLSLMAEVCDDSREPVGD